MFVSPLQQNSFAYLLPGAKLAITTTAGDFDATIVSVGEYETIVRHALGHDVRIGWCVVPAAWYLPASQTNRREAPARVVGYSLR